MATALNDQVRFRIESETKGLAQRAFERNGTNISDALREIVEKAAEDQAEFEKHDRWVTQQVNAAFDRYARGEAELISNDEVNEIMAEKKKAALASLAK